MRGRQAPTALARVDGMSTASESPYVEGVHLQRTDENVREIAALAEVLSRPGSTGCSTT